MAAALNFALLVLASAGPAHAAPPIPPVPTDDRLQISLVAAEPDIVTPVGVAVDKRGRVYVVESNTHLPRSDYKRLPHDVIRVFEDRDGDGRFEGRWVFAEDLHKTMHIAFAPDGRLFAVQRDKVISFDDKDGDGRADGRTVVLSLETTADYPHSGLGSLAFTFDGWLYVGQGENAGKPYTLRGTNGATATGIQGGHIFRCRPDGSQLTEVARGFWNPFGMALVGPFLLVADNDPDARPPNRLLDIIPDGDYGYQFRYGRNGLHPFVAWDGELPGTLPMTGAVGEAATGMLPAAAAALPAEWADTVLVTSWADHRLEAQRLRPLGASVRAEMKILVKGGDAFRPTGIAAAPDGSVFIADWVDSSYPVHGKGRLWRLSAKKGVQTYTGEPRVARTPERERLEGRLRSTAANEAPAAVADLGSNDPFIRSSAITALSRPALFPAALRASTSRDARTRLGAVLAVRRSANPRGRAVLERALADPDEEVRVAALIWQAEDHLLPPGRNRRIDAALARGPLSPRLVRTYAAAAEILGVPPAAAARAPGEATLIELLTRPATSVEEQIAQEDAVWRLSQSRSPATPAALKAFALDGTRDPQTRVDAVTVLAMLGDVAGLDGLQKDPSEIVRKGINRAVKQQNSSAVRPSDEAGWRATLSAGAGDARAGRRVFFHPGVGCSRCHRVDGIGGDVGPDMSTIGRGMDGERLFTSIFAPSREIGPENTTRVITTKDGRTIEGVVAQDPDGSLRVKIVGGEPVRLEAGQVASDIRSDISLMPEGLQETMTVQDFRDLLAFLGARK